MAMGMPALPRHAPVHEPHPPTGTEPGPHEIELGRMWRTSEHGEAWRFDICFKCHSVFPWFENALAYNSNCGDRGICRDCFPNVAAKTETVTQRVRKALTKDGLSVQALVHRTRIPRPEVENALQAMKLSGGADTIGRGRLTIWRLS
jgi:hypothetical protein